MSADPPGDHAPVYHTAVAVPQDQPKITDGDTFSLSGPGGDIDGLGPQGVFADQRRVVSRLALRVDGRPAAALGYHADHAFSGTFVLRASSEAGPEDSGIVIMRTRAVSGGCLREDLAVTNHSAEPARVTLDLEVAADATQLVDVRSGAADRSRAPIAQLAHAGGDQLWLSPESDPSTGIVVETDPRSDRPVVDVDNGRLTFSVELEPQATWRTSVGVRSTRDGVPVQAPFPFGTSLDRSAPARRSQQWRSRAAKIAAGPPAHDSILNALMVQSARDIPALLLRDVPGLPPGDGAPAPPAAGAPWFMYLYGRDALLAGMMALPLQPELLIDSVRALAQLQGVRVDPVTEEEPGKIINRVRQDPHGLPRYYGSVDATPLFVMAVGELYRWGYRRQVEQLLPNVDAALHWMTQYGDKDADGFIEYQTTPQSAKQVQNQCWRDSPDSMNFRDGTAAQTPIAAADVQGYAYAAYQARAYIAQAHGDTATAIDCRAKAAALRDRFNEQFWLSDGQYFALALDRDKRPLDVASSDSGHLLWTGIVDDDKAAVTADRLLSRELFTGFGIRSLSPHAARYNPTRYHNGTVWPHNTAVGAAGLARYGFTDHAARIADGLLAAAGHMPGNRLPELFCGFDRREVAKPVWYPASCEPQLWGATVPPLLVRAYLGLEPDLCNSALRLNPALPDTLRELNLTDLRLGADQVGIRLTRNGKGDPRNPVVTGLSPHIEVRKGPIFGPESADTGRFSPARSLGRSARAVVTLARRVVGHGTTSAGEGTSPRGSRR